MSYMFAGTSSQKNPFNQPLNNWNVSAVNNMQEMFKNSNFNQDISSWKIYNLFWSNLDTSYNYKDIFKNSGISNNNNNSIWYGWQSQLSNLPNINIHLEYTGLKNPSRLEPPWLGPKDQPGTSLVFSVSTPPAFIPDIDNIINI